MLKNLLTVAFRNFKRQKAFALIHIIGLSIGLMVCIIIALYTSNELSYDRFHTNANRIYRINETFIWGDNDALFGSTGPAVIHVLREEIPDFELLTRVHPVEPLIISRPTNEQLQAFEEEHVLAVDDTFLDIFTFPLIAGDKSSALALPNSVLITEQMAQKYFPDKDALGEYLEIGEGKNKKSYKVTGICKDVPSNSHIEFDFLLSMSSIPEVADRRDSWMWTTFVTFGLLRDDANPDMVAQKVAKVPAKYLEPFLQKYRGISYREFLESGEEWDLYIQPLLEIHLPSFKVYSRLNQTGNIQNIYILWTIGGLILILSVINFINLSTARASSRAKEVGIRKVIGSGKPILIYQFLTESMVYVFISMLIGFFLGELLLPYFNNIAATELNTKVLFRPLPISIILTTSLLIGTLAGIYPAFYLSSFQPAKVLKGKLSMGIKDGKIRNVLVTVQFAIGITMIACTLIVQDQVNYWINYDLGFDKKNKIIIKNINRLDNQMEAFKNNALTHTNVQSASIVSDTPPMIFDFDNFERKEEERYNLPVNYITADEHFLNCFDIPVIYGRGFKKEFHDSTNIVVNEYMTKAFGFKSPQEAIGNDIFYRHIKFKIIGVVANFNTTLSKANEPVAILDHKAPIFRNPHTKMVLNVKKSMTNNELQELLHQLDADWQSYVVKKPFSYTFVDQEYAEVFTQTINFGKLLKAFSVLALIIACLGLFGLVTFVIEKRSKEIGVRKVLGATIINIWMMLSKDFGKLILIGFGIAGPISWYVMTLWIQNHELRTSISLWTILASGILMIVIAGFTTSFQTIKASKINPIDYLKEE